MSVSEDLQRCHCGGWAVAVLYEPLCLRCLAQEGLTVRLRAAEQRSRARQQVEEARDHGERTVRLRKDVERVAGLGERSSAVHEDD